MARHNMMLCKNVIILMGTLGLDDKALANTFIRKHHHA